MDLIYLLARRSWQTMLIATSTGLVCGLSAAGLIAVINDGISNIEQLHSAGAIKFAVLASLVVITRVLADVSLIQLGQTAVNDLRVHLSHKLVDTPYRKLQKLGKHRLLAMLTDDTQTISQAIESVPVLLVNAGIIIACLIYMGWLSPQLLLLTTVLIVLGASAFHWPQKRALESLSQARNLKDHLFDHYRSLSDGTKELQLNQVRRKQFFDDVLQPTSQQYKISSIKGLGIYALVLNWGNSLFYLLIGLVLYVAPQMIDWQRALITGYILTILYMITPLSELMNALPTLGRASVALKKINTLENQLENNSLNNTSNQKYPISTDITLECQAVTHTYFREHEDGKFTLGPFDLNLQSGELVFITGGNGGGKTTLALLLTGLYQAETGSITINHTISAHDNSHDFRQFFSAVFTDFCLFENLLLDSSNSTLIQSAQQYLSHLRLDHKVTIDNGTLSTLDLSTGQRKRLALLASYLEDRPCYLFDEWAADQDPVFKEFFYTKILPDLKHHNKLVFVITHDDAYYHLSDRLIRVDNGQITEQYSNSRINKKT